MRYVVIIPDGAADRPNKLLMGKTPLETANIPNMHRLAKEGFIAQAQTVPTGMAPGSDVANLSILGYSPAAYYTGRAPLEAANRDIRLTPDQAVFRANTVTIKDGVMLDFAGAHPTNAETSPLIAYLEKNHNLPGVKLHHGVSYRHLCVVDNMADSIPNTTPPHDITDEQIAPYLPESPKLNSIMQRSAELLENYELNLQRINNGVNPITQLWLWGGGVMPELPSYAAKYRLKGAMISAVDLLQGIAKLIGLKVINVPGATGFYDTNYQGKGEAAIKALQTLDIVIVHVEAPDEAGHNGEADEKVQALENIDRHIVGPIMQYAEKSGDIRILCMPDHPTPLELKTHTPDSVPFIIWGKGITPDKSERFTEAEAKNKETFEGCSLLNLLIKE